MSHPPVVISTTDEDLTVTVERLIISRHGQDNHMVRIGSSDNHTSHWLTVAQARDLCKALNIQAANAAHENVEEQAQ